MNCPAICVDARIVGCNGCKAEDSTQGDGIIGPGDLWGGQYDKDTEETLFWLHLLKADLITGVSDAALTDEPIGVGTTHLAAKIKGGFYAESGGGRCSTGDHFVIWGGCQAYGHVIFLHNRINEQGTFRYGGSEYIMSPLQAASIDQKMDDGKPLTGDVRGAGRGNMPGCANDDEAYSEAETDADRCSLGFIIGE